MTSPREQAIEAVVELYGLRHRTNIREIITAYESARARIDGAKMMPREVSDVQRIAAVNTTLPGIGEPPLYEKIFHAMHDATPKDKD